MAMRKMKIFLVSVFALFISLVYGLAQPLSAQELDLPTDTKDANEDTSANLSSCFDYYTFGSVQADITANLSSVVSGTAIVLSGNLKNSNSYPIVDGSLYIKVFRERGTANDGNGPDVVDQFFVKQDINIPANGSVPVSFSWDIPSYAISGNYKIATFFTTSRKFNLLGLSFTDDIVGNTISFSVSAESKNIVQFDKSGEKVNGKAYYFATPPPRVSKDAPVVVSATIKNTTGEPQHATVTWEVNQWDAQSPQNIVQTNSVEIDIPAHGTAPVDIKVTDAKYPVYFVVGTLKYKDTKSIIGVRFVREDIDRTRINFPGVLSYPLKAGQQNTLFSCLHALTTSDSKPNGRLELILSDTAGNVIHQYGYNGSVTGDMMGVADKFIPKQNYNDFNLDALLYDQDQYVDGVRIAYECSKINPGSCTTTSHKIVEKVVSIATFDTTSIVLVLLFLLVFIAIIVTLLIK